MKSFILFLIAQVFLSSICNAIQIAGVVGGGTSTMDVSQFSTSTAVATGVGVYQGGLTTQIDFGKTFIFRTGTIFNQRAAQYTFPNTVGNINFTYAYIDIPVDFLVYLGNFSLMAGVSAGIKISSACTGTGAYSSACSGTSTEKAVILPPQVGVGWLFGNKIEIQAIYETSTTLTVLTSGTTNSSLNTTSIIGRLGYFF